MIQTENHLELIKRQAAELSAILGSGKIVLVTAHVSPDGDAIASLLAAAQIITALGSRAVCVLDAQISSRFLFLPGSDQILKPEQLAQVFRASPPEAAMVVDCGSLMRIGGVADRIPSGAKLVNVDHHPDNAAFAALNIVYPNASSTTEILFDIIRALAIPMSQDLATLLYAGLMSDTGGFRFSNTSQKTFQVAAALAQKGVNAFHVACAVYRANSAAGVKLLGEALTSLQVEEDGRIAFMTTQNGNPPDECEDAVDFALTVRGVRAAALFRVGKEGCRVSLRASGDYDVAQIARRFGGGGHQKAAGFTSRAELEEVRRQVLEALRQEVADRAVPAAEER